MDHWVPQHIAHCVFPIQGLHEEAYISKLIDQDTSAWNTSMVSSLVGELNADIICQIPLGLNSCSDRQILTTIVNGEFIVRNAYHLQMDKIDLATGECSPMRQHCLL
jgi:hypothetical protein